MIGDNGQSLQCRARQTALLHHMFLQHMRQVWRRAESIFIADFLQMKPGLLIGLFNRFQNRWHIGAFGQFVFYIGDIERFFGSE